MTNELTIIPLKGEQIHPYIDELAKLRISVFKNYPYLYNGDMAYETHYLRSYLQCPDSFMVLVIDKDTVVGASTAIPLEFESADFQKPFIDHNINLHDIFYFGESVLLPDYRGKNIYHQFFQLRELAAKAYGSKVTAFAVVERSPNDPRRPKDYLPLDTVWSRYGYKKHAELRMYYTWKEIGEETASAKPLIFWLKHL